jgi:hypothetical protein
MRFKPPPATVNMGWRVEFRSMEVQLSDYENAAFSIFIMLLTRSILHFDLNFYIPLSMVDENMKNAQQRDAIFTQLFWFRKQVTSNSLNGLIGYHEGSVSEEIIIRRVTRLVMEHTDNECHLKIHSIGSDNNIQRSNICNLTSKPQFKTIQDHSRPAEEDTIDEKAVESNL